MKKISMALGIVALFATACQKQQTPATDAQQQQELTREMVGENGQNPDDQFSTSNNQRSSGHYIYIESNAAGTNTVITYRQQGNGSLERVAETNSGGLGAGSGLASQGALAIDADKNLLFAVNAGSNSVSSFRIGRDGIPVLESTEYTRGERPVSVTAHNNLVFVVNSNTSDIAGFSISSNGKLKFIEKSFAELSQENALPAEIAFSPDGQTLIVTEKDANKITAFGLKGDGSIRNRVVNKSIGTTPFGFDFARERYLVVTNADGGNVGTSSVTGYEDLRNLDIETTNGKVPNGQSAVCWVATTDNGRYAFTANTGSNTITAYYVDYNGRLYFIPWVLAKTGDKPADILVSYDNRFVYNIAGGDNTLGIYRRGLLGTLEPDGKISNLPDFAAGLVGN